MPKKNKTEPTVFMLSFPDAKAGHGRASLTVKRGDLGHLTEFDYTALTLKTDLANAVQIALHKLVGLEISPPPELPEQDTQDTKEEAKKTEAKPKPSAKPIKAPDVSATQQISMF